MFVLGTLILIGPSLFVQERTLNMLRNLLAHCESDDVKRVLEWSQNQICGQLTSRVDPGAVHPSSQRVHALYSLVNIAAAGAEAPHVLVSITHGCVRH